jgi:hypothetical protein
MSTTRILLDRLACDIVFRRICGWEKISEIPSESTFSRTFAEFSHTELASRIHENIYPKTVMLFARKIAKVISILG